MLFFNRKIFWLNSNLVYDREMIRHCIPHTTSLLTVHGQYPLVLDVVLVEKHIARSAGQSGVLMVNGRC